VQSTLPYAIGVAASPFAIVTILLILTSCRGANSNGAIFMVGWTAGVAGVAVAFATVVRRSGVVDSHPAWIAAMELIIGAAFLAATVVFLGRRSRRREGPTPLVGAVDELRPTHAAGLGIVFASANPKNLALALGATISLAEADATVGSTVEAIALFVVVGTAGVVLPLAAHMAFPTRSRPILTRARMFVERHEFVVLVMLGLVIGAFFLVDGLRTIG
jgi:hypothetical protein